MKKTAVITATAMILTMAGAAFAGTGEPGFRHGNNGHERAEQHSSNAPARKEIGHQQGTRHQFNNVPRYREARNMHHNNIPHQAQPGHRWGNEHHYYNSRQINRRYSQGDFRGVEHNQKQGDSVRISRQNNGTASRNITNFEELAKKTDQKQQMEQRYPRETANSCDTASSSEGRSFNHNNAKKRQFNPEQRSNTGEQSYTESATDASVTE